MAQCWREKTPDHCAMLAESTPHNSPSFIQFSGGLCIACQGFRPLTATVA